MTDLLVLRHEAHGMPIEEYAAALRERLPDAEVALARTRAEERELIADAPVVTGLYLDRDLLDRADELEVFACMYAGTDHLPTEELRERGVTVTSAAGIHGPNVAEHVIGAILSSVRRFREGRRRQERREWRHYRARELRGDTVTIVGLGAIGTAIAERLEGFGVETIGVRYSPEKGGPADEVIGFDDEAFEAALARTDHLVLACPLTDVTRGIVDREALSTLPPTAFLVNVARGAVVDTDALVEALRNNRIRGAALDVTDPEPLPADHPLWTFDNVRITPHNAGHTPEYYERLAEIVAGNVRRRDRGEPLQNVVE